MGLTNHLIETITMPFIWMFVYIFTSLPGLFQDLILTKSQFLRQHVLSSLGDRLAATLASAAQRPHDTSISFEASEYYVDPASAQILKFSALHAVSNQFAEQTGDPLPPTQLLPSMSTVLLQTEEERGGEQYLEAVAAALAGQMQGVLLPVDRILLASLLAEILGGYPEDYIPLFAPSRSTSSAGKNGSSKSGRKLRLAWEALQQGLAHRRTPVVVYIRSVDSLLCSSWERYEAFTAVFGGGGGGTNGLDNQFSDMQLKYKTRPLSLVPIEGSSSHDEVGSGVGPVVVVGGAILAERGAGLLAGNSSSGNESGSLGRPDSFSGLFGGGGYGGGPLDSDEAAVSPSTAAGGGFDGGDELGSLASILLALNRLTEEPRPDARKLLAAAFPTRVNLQPPPPGSAAASKHRARIQRDVEREVEKDNYSRASAVAAATGLKVPSRGSEIYTAASTAGIAGAIGGGSLSKESWEKVLAWAVSIETLQHKKTELELKATMPTPSTVSNGHGVHHAEKEGSKNPMEAENESRGLLRQRLTPQPTTTSMRRVFSAVNNFEEYYTEGITRDSLLGVSPLPMHSLSPQVFLSSSPENKLRNKENRKQNVANNAGDGTYSWYYFFDLVESAVQKIPGGQVVLQTVFRVYDNMTKDSSVEHKLRQIFSSRKTAANKPPPYTPEITASKSDNKTDGDFAQQFPVLTLSEASVRYGIAMLWQSGGGPRATIQPENSYEKQLLGQVLSPEDLGAGKGSGSYTTPAGFSHIGALKEAKQVLQETVQLPLQRPDLFQHGALAKPPSGVLLFGPPGTGKTLLARATAAESGASFLELSLSSLSSKYYGDSTKLVRAAFTLAEKLAPCVLFVDEVDALLGRRSSTGREHEATRELKNEFMSRWDSIRTTASNRTTAGTGWVMVLGATNRPFDLDEAVLRRFSVRVAVELPNKNSRRDILNVILEGQPKEESVDVEKIAEETEGFSGADLRQLCVAAAMRPIRELVGGETDTTTVSMAVAAKNEESTDALNSALTTPLNSQPITDTSSILPLSSPQLVSAFADATNLAQGVAGGSFLASPAAGVGGDASSQRPRPVNQADFSAARRDVGPTVDLDSSVIQELKEWDRKFGSVGGEKRRAGGRDTRLLYYT